MISDLLLNKLHDFPLTPLTQEVCEHRKGTNTQPTKGGSCGNVAIQLVDHGLLPVTPHYHLLLLELLGNLHIVHTVIWLQH